MGSVGEQTNQSGMGAKPRRSNRVQVKNFPVEMSKESIEQLVSSFGKVLRCDVEHDSTESFISVTYETPDEAKSAVDQLNGHDVNGFSLQVQFMRSGPRGGPRTNGFNSSTRAVGNSYPLRILVPSELVGAVIGKKGVTIRNITTQCKARVDVHGKDNAGLIEKVISIYGQPENCSSACKEILQVIHKEPSFESRGGTVPLKMLIDDRYCGRIIGKEGKIIKKIREDTETKITISSVQEMAVIYPDRVITIQGTVDNMVAAQAAISIKLAECLDKEMQSGGAMILPPGAMPMMPSTGAPYSPNMRRAFGPAAMSGVPVPYPPSYAAGAAPYCPMGSNGVEMCQIVVPDKAVGAIIGAGGSMIKQIMDDSGAHVTVEPRKDTDASSAVERIVTIRGTSDACWKASYFVFEKVRDESSAAAASGGAGDVGDVKLRTMLTVPRAIAGRIIGRQGKTVREIQRMTGAMVKLSEESAGTHNTEETIAEVYGNFMATQGAHSRIRALINEEFVDGGYQPPMNAPRGAARRPGPPPVAQQA